MLTRVIRLAVISLACWLAVVTPHAIDARAETVGVSRQNVGEIVLGESAESSNLVLGRLSVAPGGTVRLSSVPGPSAHFVLTGSWTARVTPVPVAATPGDGIEGAAANNGDAAVDGTPADAGASVTVAAGSDMLVPGQAELEIHNTADVPAVSLAVFVGGPLQLEQGSDARWWPIGDPLVVPAGEIHVDASRLTLAAGASEERHDTGRIEVVDVDAGPLLLVVNPGQVRITRANGRQETIRSSYEDPSASPEVEEDEGGPGLVSSPPGTPIAGTATMLGAGDGAVIAPGGSRVLGAPSDASAIVLLLGVWVAPDEP